MATKSIEEVRSHSPAPSTLRPGQQFGNPVGVSLYAGIGTLLTMYLQSPLAMGTFATTLLTLSLSMMGFRGVETQTIFIGNLCLAAGLCMFVSAQWEMVRGNTFGYSALSAYGKSISKSQWPLQA